MISTNSKSIFTKIIERTLPAYIVAEDTAHIAFLDVAPITKGHTLVVPKRQVDYFFALEDAELGALITFAKKVAYGIEQVIDCQRIGIKVYGLEVPHAHMHLLPISNEATFHQSSGNLQLPPGIMETIAAAIRTSLAKAESLLK